MVVVEKNFMVQTINSALIEMMRLIHIYQSHWKLEFIQNQKTVSLMAQ